MVKNEFFLNNSKNIDIWILRKEQNLISLVKIDWEMPVKNPRWPPRNLVLLPFQHQTAVMSPRIIVIALFLFFLTYTNRSKRTKWQELVLPKMAFIYLFIYFLPVCLFDCLSEKPIDYNLEIEKKNYLRCYKMKKKTHYFFSFNAELFPFS